MIQFDEHIFGSWNQQQQGGALPVVNGVAIAPINGRK